VGLVPFFDSSGLLVCFPNCVSNEEVINLEMLVLAHHNTNQTLFMIDYLSEMGWLIIGSLSVFGKKMDEWIET